MSKAGDNWAVGKATVNGKPVIYKFTNEVPDINTRYRTPWLTVVSWKYDGSTNNGMPLKARNLSHYSIRN